MCKLCSEDNPHSHGILAKNNISIKLQICNLLHSNDSNFKYVDLTFKTKHQSSEELKKQ